MVRLRGGLITNANGAQKIMTHALIIDACRTPRGIGKADKGALAEIHPQRLGATVLKALVERTGINTADVDDVIWGTNAQRGIQSNDLGRMSALDAGFDVHSSGVTLDRFCGSGITAAVLAFGLHLIGHRDVAVYDGSWAEWGLPGDTPIEP